MGGICPRPDGPRGPGCRGLGDGTLGKIHSRFDVKKLSGIVPVPVLSKRWKFPKIIVESGILEGGVCAVGRSFFFFLVERLHMILCQPVDRRGSVLRVEARSSVGGL